MGRIEIMAVKRGSGLSIRKTVRRRTCIECGYRLLRGGIICNTCYNHRDVLVRSMAGPNYDDRYLNLK